MFFVLICLMNSVKGRYDYRWEIARCQNETIRAEVKREMFFVSPSFPNINNAEFDCTWRLQAPPGMRVKIGWEVFHLDSCGEGNTNSKVMVFDGKVEKHTEMVKFCGKQLPPKFVSTSRDLHIVLKQLVQDHGKGVKIMCGFQATTEPASNIRARPALSPATRPMARPTRTPFTRKNIPTFSNAVMEVPKHDGDFPDNYYYDYEFEREQHRRQLIEEKQREEREHQKTLKHKFNKLDKEDQWALIGAACCIIVVLAIVSYMMYQRRKRLSQVEETPNAETSRRQRSLEKRSRSMEKN